MSIHTITTTGPATINPAKGEAGTGSARHNGGQPGRRPAVPVA